MKIAIASGKGGTGKTFVATNLYRVAENCGHKATLVDCDAEEPNVAGFLQGELATNNPVSQNVPVIDTEKCTFCGMCQMYCKYNAIVCLPEQQYIRVVEDLCHDCGACLYACQYEAISEKIKQIGEVNSYKINSCPSLIESRTVVGAYSPVPVIKAAICAAPDETLAILDSPPGISCPFIATVVPADYVVLVTEPTPFGLNDLKLSAETLQQLGKPFGVIVNRAGLGNREVYKWLDKNKIPLLMEIPFDRDIARIYSEGHLLVDKNEYYHGHFVALLKVILQSQYK